jgi:hypothetical protein
MLSVKIKNKKREQKNDILMRKKRLRGGLKEEKRILRKRGAINYKENLTYDEDNFGDKMRKKGEGAKIFERKKNLRGRTEKNEKNEKNEKYEKNVTKNSQNFERCKIIQASESDFQNPILFFEKLWTENADSTGIIKIIPPKNWKEINDRTFNSIYHPSFEKCGKKIEIRKQQLNNLLYGKVKLFTLTFFRNLTTKKNSISKNTKILQKNLKKPLPTQH